MAAQFSVAVRNARLDAIFAVIGASAVLEIRTLAPPANTSASGVGSVLATFQLPVTYVAAASNGVVVKAGTWEDTAADTAGVAGHFRLYASNGTTCHMQGTVTATGGGGDMTLDSVTVAVNQDVLITGFTLTDPNG